MSGIPEALGPLRVIERNVAWHRAPAEGGFVFQPSVDRNTGNIYSTGRQSQIRGFPAMLLKWKISEMALHS
jgi:hypothetical protein